ncbi:MAG: response regulator [Candidatus Firestonebacteria bacterium]
MSKKVLIIDNDADFVEFAKTTLLAEGFTVVSSSGGKQCLSTVNREMPDAILFDVMTEPGVDGFETLRKLAGGGKLKVPVLMVSGIRKEMNLPFGFEADEEWLPAKAVLEKPVKAEVLLSEIKKAMK